MPNLPWLLVSTRIIYMHLILALGLEHVIVLFTHLLPSLLESGQASSVLVVPVWCAPRWILAVLQLSWHSKIFLSHVSFYKKI